MTEKNFQALPTQIDTIVALIYKIFIQYQAGTDIGYFSLRNSY
jgi:hypothetical protein